MRARLVTLKTIADPGRGTMSIAEVGPDVPFPVERVFYMYGLPKDGERGQHAHRAQHQFVIAMHGVLEARTWSASGEHAFSLDHPGIGLHIPPLTWLVIRAMTQDAVSLVLTSAHYDEGDYIRDRAEFVRLIGG
jgi:hypothetical protein